MVVQVVYEVIEPFARLIELMHQSLNLPRIDGVAVLGVQVVAVSVGGHMTTKPMGVIVQALQRALHRSDFPVNRIDSSVMRQFLDSLAAVVDGLGVGEHFAADVAIVDLATDFVV